MGTLLEEKSASGEETDKQYAPPLQEGEGWQILKEDFYREVKVNAARFFAGLLLLGGVICGGFWAFKQLTSVLPQVYKDAESRLAKLMPPKVVPSLPAVAPSPVKSGDTAGGGERPRLKARSRHTAHRSGSRGTASVRPRQNYWGVENPTGGVVIYTDGTITEYSWH